jgi:hypothetical protein
MTEPIDYIEVGRRAHQLAERLGRHAHRRAANQTEPAPTEGAIDDQRFWEGSRSRDKVARDLLGSLSPELAGVG